MPVTGVDGTLTGRNNSRFLAPVAQLDRVPGYELGGREFESLRARHIGEGAAAPFFACDGSSSSFSIEHDEVEKIRRSQPNRMNDRGIAQPGRPPALGAGCREFESLYPDQLER